MLSNHTIPIYAKANNKYVKNSDKNKDLSYIQYQMQIIYMDGQCLKNYQSIVLNRKKYMKSLMKI